VSKGKFESRLLGPTIVFGFRGLQIELSNAFALIGPRHITSFVTQRSVSLSQLGPAQFVVLYKAPFEFAPVFGGAFPKATAIQFNRRFFCQYSPAIYEPLRIGPCAPVEANLCMSAISCSAR